MKTITIDRSALENRRPPVLVTEGRIVKHFWQAKINGVSVVKFDPTAPMSSPRVWIETEAEVEEWRDEI